MFGARQSERPFRIEFLLVPGFSMMAFAAAAEPLRVANRFGGDLYRWSILTRTGNPAIASNGMALVADRSYDAAQAPMLIVCAGFDPEREYDGKLGACLRRRVRDGADLGAIDTGSFLLARAGLLDGMRATTHWESLDSFRERFPKVEAETGLFTIDHNRFSCAGGTAALDMMLYLISLQHGQKLATEVSDQFIYTRMRGAHDEQRLNASVRQGIRHAALARVITAMEETLEEPLPAVRLAARAQLSLRQLERLFRHHLQTTPGHYYRELRLRRARALLQYTAMPVLEVGIASGFASAAHFSRAYRNWAGRPPREERHGTSR